MVSRKALRSCTPTGAECGLFPKRPHPLLARHFSEVGGASHRQPRPIEHVCVDLRRRHVRVAEKLLERPDVLAGIEKVRGEGVPKRTISSRGRRSASPKKNVSAHRAWFCVLAEILR